MKKKVEKNQDNKKENKQEETILFEDNFTHIKDFKTNDIKIIDLSKTVADDTKIMDLEKEIMRDYKKAKKPLIFKFFYLQFL